MSRDENICLECMRGYELNEDEDVCLSCDIDHCSSCDFLYKTNSTGSEIMYPTCTQCDPTFSQIEWFYWIDDLKKLEKHED